MAKAKTTTTDLDKRLKSIDELVESTEFLIAKFQGTARFDKDTVSEFRKQLTSLRKLKESFGQDIPSDAKKRVDQAIGKVKNILKDKQKPPLLSQEVKARTLESLDDALESLNDKLEELKAQVEGGHSKKKGKNQNKGDKPEKWIENIEQHIARLNNIRSQFEGDATVEQDQTLKEIISYFQDDYIGNAEYQQSQTSFIDGLYESFEKPDEPLNDSFQDEDTPSDISGSKSPVKEERKEGIASNVGQGVGNNSSFMAKVRQSSFDHAALKMPKINERDLQSELNFFDVFEAGAKNLPQETDYYPNAVTKEKVITKTIYPKRKIVDDQKFGRFDVDVLFFIFYFQKDTYEQYLAVKELRNRGWRFHKKYLTWFKRLEPPRVTTDDYEQGTYAFFDFEPGGWCQRKKSDFTFKYSYLDDQQF